MAMVLFVVGMTAFTSCTKSNEKMILGKWKLENVTASFAGQTFNMSVSDLIALLELEGEEVDVEEVILEFKNDGYVYFQGEGVRYTVDDDILTLEEDENKTLQATITEMTKSEMTLEGEEKDEETGMTMVFGLYFKRI